MLEQWASGGVPTAASTHTDQTANCCSHHPLPGHMVYTVRAPKCTNAAKCQMKLTDKRRKKREHILMDVFQCSLFHSKEKLYWVSWKGKHSVIAWADWSLKTASF